MYYENKNTSFGFFLFLASKGFSRNGKSILQVEIFQVIFFTYIFQEGNQSYRANGNLIMDELQVNF
ncbi:MAG: hypothetical protein CVU03_09910 [Bacteroidetes bacterium HGW-Bacteroidetes-2]|jgi:hypothetical protein|nr:MAG: hypothetical protein CVU03_09910 [Bacteroidetes bacterium HGW-Bacteroidetes-2]